MVVYLNNAGQAELSPEVKAAGIAAIQQPPWEPHATGDDQQRVRECFASLIEADASDVAIMPSTAFAITLAARNIQRLAATKNTKGKILLLQDQFNSAVYPWQQICEESNGSVTLQIIPHPPPNQEHGWTKAILDRLDSNVIAACLPPLHWSNGALIDLETIGEVCRHHDIPLIVDATQGKNTIFMILCTSLIISHYLNLQSTAVGIMDMSVKKIQPTLVACSVHKVSKSRFSINDIVIDRQGLKLCFIGEID